MTKAKPKIWKERKKILTLNNVWMYGDKHRSWQLSGVLIIGTLLLLPLWMIYGVIYGIYKKLK